MKFSLIFFSDTSHQPASNPYEFIAELARFGDQHGFEAVWIPERHFNTMGGIYPAPAVIAAFLAPLTRRIRLRAGSVILPLHHPASIVEAWTIVDNLSNGRVDLAVASGWNVNDFLLSPSTYQTLRDVWLERIPTIQRLWRGAPVTFSNGRNEPTQTIVYPRPVQPELNLWLTISKQRDSFIKAGELGLNVLTMLAGSSLEQLAENIQLYRKARTYSGFSPEGGVVTLMLHTYLHESIEKVREIVSAPLLRYIRKSLRTHLDGGAVNVGQQMSEREIDKMAGFSFERYFTSAALFGTISDAERVISSAQSAGVGEIACLLDYGLTKDEIRAGLPHLSSLQRLHNQLDAAGGSRS